MARMEKRNQRDLNHLPSRKTRTEERRSATTRKIPARRQHGNPMDQSTHQNKKVLPKKRTIVRMEFDKSVHSHSSRRSRRKRRTKLLLMLKSSSQMSELLIKKDKSENRQLRNPNKNRRQKKAKKSMTTFPQTGMANCSQMASKPEAKSRRRRNNNSKT